MNAASEPLQRFYADLRGARLLSEWMALAQPVHEREAVRAEVARRGGGVRWAAVNLPLIRLRAKYLSTKPQDVGSV
jgi:hypothetical protein